MVKLCICASNKVALTVATEHLLLLFSCLVVSDFHDPIECSDQAPLSMGFPRQEYWSTLPFPSPEDLPDPGIKPTSPALAGRFFITESPGKPYIMHTYIYIT